MVRRGNIRIHDTNCIRKPGTIIPETQSRAVLVHAGRATEADRQSTSDVVNVKPEAVRTVTLCPI